MNDLTMKNMLEKPIQFSKVEFWGATTIFVFSVFFLSTNMDSSSQYYFDEAKIPFNYYEDYFFPQLIKYTLLYLAFLLFNFKIVPNLLRKESVAWSVIMIVLTFVVIGLVFGIADTYAKNYLFNKYNDVRETYNVIFRNSFRYALWLIFMFGFYTFIKYAAMYLLSNSVAIQSKYRILTRDALAALVIWMVSMFLLMVINAPREIIVGWGLIIPAGILLYCYSFYYLIPQSLTKKKPFMAYALRVLLVLIVAFLPIALLGILLTQDEEYGFAMSFFNSVFQLFITIPLSWVLFRRQMQGNEEVYVLQKELGRSNANLDFLRSQINPHFLFNALNTLYGTALQENSERTAQGIQMLGDMMRFMLHENLQQKILLSREIEYMCNYIDLQLLRTSSSPDIVIQTKIEEVIDDKFIAPMLLIPFVENAFKHGISHKNKSWIKVTLHSVDNKIFFDVYNSTHAKTGQDPEQDKSGIGLKNVKQRLALLYPDKHELIIRETADEYFVHLTLQL